MKARVKKVNKKPRDIAYGAKKQGLSHVSSGTPCQDSFIAYSRNDFSCICLSDGAGSAAHSQEGSALLVKETNKYLKTKFDALYSVLQNNNELKFKQSIIKNGLLALNKISETGTKNIGDYAATLLFVALKGDKLIWGHIGDGIIGARKESGYEVISSPFNGQFANQTVFITSPNALEYMKCGACEISKAYTDFFIMSDGPEPVFYLKRENRIITTNLLDWIIIRCCIAQNKSREPIIQQNVLAKICSEFSSDDLSIALISRNFSSRRKKYLRTISKQKKRSKKKV